MQAFSVKKLLIGALAAGGGLLLMVAATLLLLQEVNGPPFRLIIEPENDHASVQFTQPNARLVSRSFPINLHFDERHEVILDSASVSIPGGRVEFADTTILPGRFKVRFGETLFDVMQNGIEVGGQLTDWKTDDSRETP
ncbi:MAG: hypothetical protein EXS05_03385 [Planctomycetaceae bacterium]|nr:hypothetical protein [Planctomycetaceae bacterium]